MARINLTRERVRWQEALTSKVVDESAMREAFANHLRILQLPARDCIFHPSPDHARKWFESHEETEDEEWHDWRTGTLALATADAAACCDAFLTVWEESLDLNCKRTIRLIRQAIERSIVRGYDDFPYTYDLIYGGAVEAEGIAQNDLAWEATWEVTEWHPYVGEDIPVNPWRPLSQAFATGAFIICVTKLAVHVLLRPEVVAWGPGDDPHCETGPVLRWPDGSGWYYLQGVRVPEKVVLAPKTLTPQEILAEWNIEVRRLMIERFGTDRLIREVGAEVVDESSWGRLYRLAFWNDRLKEETDEPLVMVEVTCPSTGRKFMLRVHPEMSTAQEAIAWTFNLRSGAYSPIKET